MGKSVCQLGALFDLHLSLAKLLGLLCSATLSTKNGEHFEDRPTSHRYRSSHPPPPARHQVASLKSEARKVEENLVHSNLWKTLFRGGYMVGKLTRSLSGAYVRQSHQLVLYKTHRLVQLEELILSLPVGCQSGRLCSEHLAPRSGT